MKLCQTITICYGNITEHNENRTPGRHTATIGSNAENGCGGIAGRVFSDPWELARAESWECCGRVAGLHLERR